MKHAERWRENPVKALAKAGFSQHFECGIHWCQSSLYGSFALIPHPVARWAKTTQRWYHLCLYGRRCVDRGGRRAMFTNVTCLWRHGLLNRGWQPQHHGLLLETLGTLWILGEALTNQRCARTIDVGLRALIFQPAVRLIYSFSGSKIYINKKWHIATSRRTPNHFFFHWSIWNGHILQMYP